LVLWAFCFFGVQRACNEDRFRIDDTSVHKAIREALANCLFNADYYRRGGVVVLKKLKEIALTNHGNFCIEIDEANSGGFLDPRNGAMLKSFNLMISVNSPTAASRTSFASGKIRSGRCRPFRSRLNRTASLYLCRYRR
jgi:hypothetical protein